MNTVQYSGEVTAKPVIKDKWQLEQCNMWRVGKKVTGCAAKGNFSVSHSIKE